MSLYLEHKLRGEGYLAMELVKYHDNLR
jgi:hypothetical protein